MILLHFCDIFPGFNQEKNFFTSCFQELFGTVQLTLDPCRSDVIITSIFGNNHQNTISNFGSKTILWLGENIRPNTLSPAYSISCDIYDYNGTNTRLPLWFLEIDRFKSGVGLFKLEDIYNKCVRVGSLDATQVSEKQFCISIFNNPEGMRMSALSSIQSISPVQTYGRPFGNWFPTTKSYSEKLKRMSNYAFNFCPENSYFPGYYTEKVLHAKMAQSVPIYMADPHLRIDFRPQCLVNLYDFPSSAQLIRHIKGLYYNKAALASLLNEPLFTSLPKITPFLSSLYRITLSILSR